MLLPTGNLLFDSLSRNTGDIAMGIAAQQLLDARAFPSRIVRPFDPVVPSPLIIGGGELIRTSGDAFYDSFRQRGPHILNAAGVWSGADDLGYLNEYSFVSARSEVEVDVLRRSVPDAQLLPCATTLLSSDHFEIPGIEPGETVVGIHMVPHSLRLIEDLVPIINAIPHKKVFIPFTHYNGDASFMGTLPFDRDNTIFLDTLTPLQLHSVISQMSYVVVSSLHASIFAYSQNVPFASVHQVKAEQYFQDRGLADHMVRNDRELIALLDRLNSDKFDFTGQITHDHARVNKAFDQYVEILRQVPAGGEFVAPATPQARREDVMLLDQAQLVIRDHDLALSHSESRRMALKHEVVDLNRTVVRGLDERQKLRGELERTVQALNAANSILERQRQVLWRRIGRRARGLLRRFTAVFQ